MAEKEWQAKYGKTDDAWEQVKRRELKQRLEEVAVTLGPVVPSWVSLTLG
jgi:hypothetical protein